MSSIASPRLRRLVFAGLFSADGLKVRVGDGGVEVLEEGRSRKFVARVGQVTFSGALARERGQPVLYVTERCVFELRQDGVALVEVARGVNVERDILARLAFKPIVDIRKTMDERIFREEPMNLRASLLDVDFAHWIAYDAARDVLFVNLEAASIRNPADIEAMRAAIEAALAPVGRKTRAIVNYAFDYALKHQRKSGTSVCKANIMKFTDGLWYDESRFIGNVKFHIDVVDGLGSFMEIEAIDAEGTIGRDTLLAQCQEYLRLFGIASADLVAVSYSDLLLAQAGAGDSR